MFPQAKPSRTLRVKGKQNSLFPEGPVIKCFVIPPNSKYNNTRLSAYDFIARFPEQGVKVCFAKFVEAFVQILLFAEISQRSHGTVGRVVSRFGAFIA